MRKNSKGFLSKKLAMCLLSLSLFLVGVCFLSPEGSKVIASDSNASTFKVEALDIGKYTETDGDTIARTAPKPSTASDYKDWIFAGWYTDQACTRTVSKTTKNGTYYAKFVPAEVLSAKCQVSAETDGKSETSKLRIISTVDSLKYSQVGFDLVFKDKTIPYSTNKVFSKIEAATDGVAYGFSPNIFDLQSEYFITATLINIKNEDFDAGILIKPYWVTKDGTKVYGVSRYARVEDSYLGIVNVPVRLYSDSSAASGTATVTYDANKFEYLDTYTSSVIEGSSSTSGYDNGYVFDNVNVSNNVENKNGTLTVSASSNKNLKADGMLVNLRLKKKADVSLPKKNEFTVGTSLKDESSNAVTIVAPNVVYMNYMIGTYSGVADTSWYDSSKTTFVITTPEELFGFASLVNDGKITDQTVCLGADIIVNGGWTASATAPTYPWSKIGSDSLDFAGTFDGQGHSISGIYINEEKSAGYVGLFAYASGEIKNFSLENSYIASDGNMIGSIVGFLTGNMSGVSSSAIVVNTADGNVTASPDDTDYLERECGGLVGRFGSGSERTISNCQFSGSATSSNRELGGIVGRIAMGKKTIAHCLNTGTVHTKMIEGAWAGGLVGSVHPQLQGNGTLILKDCLNSGDVTREQQVALIGAGIGYIRNSYNPQVTIEDTYATKESCVTSTAIGLGMVTTGNIELCSEEELSGYMGYLTANLYFYTEHNKKNGGYWVVNADSTPTLLSFSDTWVDFGWYFASDDITTYEISTAEELYGLEILSRTLDFEGETIKVTADITINEGNAKNWGTVEPKNTWIPIGSITPFAGTFDGQEHTISGLYMNDIEQVGYVAMFAQASGTIKNFSLKNSYFASNGYIVGSIVGLNTGTVERIYSDALVESEVNVVGGLIGQARGNAIVTNCWYAGEVKAVSEVGGIVGGTHGSATLHLDNCYNSNNVSGSSQVGGIVGNIRANGTLIATNSINVGVISATGTKGNILGNNGGVAKISKSYGVADTAELENGSIEILTSEQLTGAQARYSTALGFYGEDEATDNWVARKGNYPGLKCFVPESEWYTEDEEIIADTSWYNTANTEIYIDTAAKLYGLAEKSLVDTYWNDTIYLTADITVNIGDAKSWRSVELKPEWQPIGDTNCPFNGIFDGQGHTIRGVFVNATGDYAGLFGATDTQTRIEDLRLENSYIYGSGYHVGSIAGRGNGTFDTLYSNATVVSGGYNAGGIVGQMNSGANNEITNCWFDGSVMGNRAGGMVGFVLCYKLTMTNCLNTGSISAGENVGGLCGYRAGSADPNYFTIRNSIATGELTGISSANVGAIVGQIDAGKEVDADFVYGRTDYSVVGKNNGTLKTGKVDLLSKEQFTGAQARYSTALGFHGEEETTDYWVAREGKYPGLKCFVPESEWYTGDETVIPDTSWYDVAKDTTNGSTFVIDTAAKLYGLAQKAESDSYWHATVKLGADITVNIGDADKWGTTAAVNNWTPIGSVYPFAGKFDGQGYTIKGLYLNTDTQYGGLFAQVNLNASAFGSNYLSNFRIENSYFQSSSANLGSVAGYIGVDMSNVYSDAIVVTNNKQCGGLVGQFNNFKTISGCWFDGTIISTCTDAQQGCGGLIGLVDRGVNKIENSLNTGDITVTSGRTESLLGVGGLVGMSTNAADKMIQLEITDCINAGVVTVDHPRGIGSVIGVLKNTTEYTNTLILTNVYTTNQYVETSSQYDWVEDVCTGIGINLNSTATVTGAVIETSEDDRFIGYAAYDSTEKLDFENTWVLRKVGVPAPKTLVPEAEQYTTVDADLALSTLGTDITLRGNGVDAGDGSYVISVPDTDGSIYANYLEALNGKDFEMYANNDAGLGTQGVQNVVYTKEENGFKWMVSVTHAGNEKQKTYVAISTSEALSPHLKGAVTYTKDDAYTASDITPTFTMMKLTETNASGNSFVIQLSNGHFIINDGGYAADLPNLIAYLKELSNGQKPIVEAWVISHAHSDHWGVFEQLYNDSQYNNHNWSDELYVEGIYYNESAAYVKGNFTPIVSTNPETAGELIYDVLGSIYNEEVKRGMKLLKTTNGDSPEIYRYRTGQRFTFADVTMDVVQMEENVFEYLNEKGYYSDGSNGTSSTIMFTIEEKRVYIGGDETRDNMRWFTQEAYNDTCFNNLDVYVAPHHGMNTFYDFGQWCTNSGTAKFGMVLFPCVSEYPPLWQGVSTETNYKLINEFTKDKTVYTYANKNVVLSIGDTIQVR